MVRGVPRIALLAGLLLTGSFAAFAQSDDWTACAKTSGAAAMAACDRAISSGELTGRALALAHSNRGVEWTARGDVARAIADYDQAIQHDPSQAAAFHNRGIARASKRDFDGAIADYDEAIRRNPKYASAFGRRGLAYFSKGDLDRAISDYDQSIRLDDKQGRHLFRGTAGAGPAR